MRTRGDKIYVKYVGKLDDGSIFDCSRGDCPVEFTIGTTAILPGLVDAFSNMKVGEKAIFTLAPSLAYGEYDNDALISYPKNDFPNADALTAGEMIEFFADGKALRSFPTVFSCDGDTVILDFNHPLAGKTVSYEIEIVGEERKGD